jgi:hypothetical protein
MMMEKVTLVLELDQEETLLLISLVKQELAKDEKHWQPIWYQLSNQIRAAVLKAGYLPKNPDGMKG